MNRTFLRLAQIVKLPIILSHFKNNIDNTLELCILGETKKEGFVRYTYELSNGPIMQKILRKKVFCFKDWNFIKEQGELVKREVCGNV